eukprot:6211161-Pleurochrysis_carterae.AAC.4
MDRRQHTNQSHAQPSCVYNSRPQSPAFTVPYIQRNQSLRRRLIRVSRAFSQSFAAYTGASIHSRAQLVCADLRAINMRL